jgi:hypothetical protein
MIHREMGLGGWEGSRWSRGVGLPFGISNSVFVPHAATGSASAKTTSSFSTIAALFVLRT